MRRLLTTTTNCTGTWSRRRSQYFCGDSKFSIWLWSTTRNATYFYLEKLPSNLLNCLKITRSTTWHLKMLNLPLTESEWNVINIFLKVYRLLLINFCPSQLHVTTFLLIEPLTKWKVNSWNKDFLFKKLTKAGNYHLSKKLPFLSKNSNKQNCNGKSIESLTIMIKQYQRSIPNIPSSLYCWRLSTLT